MSRAPLFAFTAPETMTEPVFAAMLLVLAQMPWQHLEDQDSNDPDEATYTVGGYETAAFTISCLLAQRFRDSIGTGDVVEALQMDQAMLDDAREDLIRDLITRFDSPARRLAMGLERLHAQLRVQVGSLDNPDQRGALIRSINELRADANELLKRETPHET